MKIGDRIKLTWESLKGRDIINKHGDTWKITVVFRNTPIIQIESVQTRYQRNINWPISDRDFKVIQIN